MEDKSYLPDCSDDDVCSFASGMFKVNRFRQAVKTAVVGQLEEALKNALKSQGLEINTAVYVRKVGHSQQRWFGEGVDCEMLRLGAKGWQKGKVRIRVSLEFCPDEPEVPKTPESNKPEIAQSESPLDDIRRMINENS